MSRERKTLAGTEKLAILKRYLVEKVPISDLCDQYGLLRWTPKTGRADKV